MVMVMVMAMADGYLKSKFFFSFFEDKINEENKQSYVTFKDTTNGMKSGLFSD